MGKGDGIIKLRIKKCKSLRWRDPNFFAAASYIPLPYWWSPQTASDKVDDCTKSNVWSLGITCIEMAIGKPPYSDTSLMETLYIISKTDPPPPTLPADEKWSKEFRDFIALCLIKDEKKRASVDALLNHEWIKNAKSKYLLQDWITDSIEKLKLWQITSHLKVQRMMKMK